MRRLVGILVLLGLVSAPAVARARMFCRFTGAEIIDCAEQRIPDATVVQNDDCCERHVVPALATARVTSEHAEVVPVLVAATFVRLFATPLPAATLGDHRITTDGGPPLYVVQRALLI